MLNIFPEFLIPFLAPTILRIGVGATILVQESRIVRKYSKQRGAEFITSVFLFISGAFLIIGLYVQLAALYLLLDSIVRLAKPEYRKKGLNRGFYVLLIAAALSLFLSGAGAFAVDIPL